MVLQDITTAASALVYLWSALAKERGSGAAAGGDGDSRGARVKSKGRKGGVLSDNNSTVQHSTVSTDSSILRDQEAVVMGVLGSAVQLFGALKAEVAPSADVAGQGGQDGQDGSVETSPVDAAESALHQCLEMAMNSTANKSGDNSSPAVVSRYTTLWPTVFPRAPTKRELKLLHGQIEGVMA